MTQTVLHFTDSTGFGGAERALLHLLAGLDRERWRPVLVHHDSPGISQLLAEARAHPVATHSIPPMPPGPRSLIRLPHLLRLLSVERPSVFHAHLTWPLACTYGLAAAILARVPAVVATVQLYVDLPYGRWVRVRQRLLTAGVGRYVAVSRDVAGRLQRTFGIPADKVRVVHNAVPVAVPPQPSLCASTSTPARPVVLTTARLDPQKGLDDLLDAATRVSDAHFVVAGGGPEHERLVARAHTMGLRDRVRFLGHRPEVSDLLAACDLFVLPSRYEGLPLSILEAMAAGKPVVATAIGGTNEAVVHGETGLLVPPADGAALAHAIRMVLADPGLAARLGDAGRARVQHEFSTQEMVRRVTAIYDELLAGSWRPRA